MMNLHELSAHLQDDQISETVLEDGSGVLLDLAGQRVLSLNDSGMLLVSQLRNGVAERVQLVAAMTQAFEVSHEQAGADVDDFLQELQGLFTGAPQKE
ncbi:MAG: PqqD family protein [gamma proteobacterium symbiont of Bathyaustriella thionipta]|nr:PqqD family protein [gamma proteobacterium symbiont of Bathyaustriella thionipta]